MRTAHAAEASRTGARGPVRHREALGPDASKALHLTDEKRDNTHMSVRGATEYAALVAGGLAAQGLISP
ncbi:hypothetical protein [Streptomyces sp. NRRL S-118]|uniref:hypothetical protein n=1 Tax=Streptomyces sp. NRRL S-118 TaxID=1463881 RepID=UPI0004C7DE52